VELLLGCHCKLGKLVRVSRFLHCSTRTLPRRYRFATQLAGGEDCRSNRGTNDVSKIGNYLTAADQELSRVSAMAIQTLRFHRQSTRATLVVCDDLLTSVLLLYQARLKGSDIKVEKRKRTDRPVTCFEGEIRQALSNFIGNALDAMTPGGRLLLRSREATNWKTGGKGLIVTIADTGSGISTQAKTHLFEPFLTTKGSGNGLGLWISDEIISRHKGRIKMRSSTDQRHAGSVVSIFLPFEPVSLT
jgi:signal transduction histidine kinase